MRSRLVLALGLQAVAAPAAALGASGGAFADGVSAWGSGYYLAIATERANEDLRDEAIAQEVGLSVNLRSDTGLDLLADFALPVSGGGAGPARTLVQQLALRVTASEALSLVAGKQRLNWGTARLFSAIDTLETRANPLDVRTVLAGVAGIEAVVIPNDWMSFTVVALPAARAQWSRGAARLDLLLAESGLDLGVGVVRYLHGQRDDSASAQPSARPALLSDAAWSTGTAVLYYEAQLRWSGERGYYLPPMRDLEDFGGGGWQAVARAVAGASLQLDAGLTRPVRALAEYLFNGDGLSEGEARAFADDYRAWLASGAPAGAQLPGAFAGIGGLRRHYAAVAVGDIAVARYLLLGANGVLGLDSHFVRLAATVEWQPTQDLAVVFGYEHFTKLSGGGPSERLLIPFRNRLALTISAAY